MPQDLTLLRVQLDQLRKTVHDLECTFSLETYEVDVEAMSSLQQKVNDQWTNIKTRLERITK